MNFVDDKQGQYIGSFADFSGGKVGIVQVDAPKGKGVEEKEVKALEDGLAAIKAAEAKAVADAKIAADKAKAEAEKSALLKEIKAELALLGGLKKRIEAVIDAAGKFVDSTFAGVAKDAKVLVKDGKALVARIDALIKELTGAQTTVSGIDTSKTKVATSDKIVSPANPAGLSK